MTPTFMGSEPVVAESGRWAGTAVLQGEQDKGLAFMRSLTADPEALALAGEEPVLVTGSLFLIGEYLGLRGEGEFEGSLQ